MTRKKQSTKALPKGSEGTVEEEVLEEEEEGSEKDKGEEQGTHSETKQKKKEYRIKLKEDKGKEEGKEEEEENPWEGRNTKKDKDFNRYMRNIAEACWDFQQHGEEAHEPPSKDIFAIIKATKMLQESPLWMLTKRQAAPFTLGGLLGTLYEKVHMFVIVLGVMSPSFR